MSEPWRLGYLEPWTVETEPLPDDLKHLIYQYQERESQDALPHVVEQIPMKRTVMGLDSPHQMGDHTPYDILERAAVYSLTSHFTLIEPGAANRGAHRHLSAPTLFCVKGQGWELNDEVLYEFGERDMLTVPPYTIHQHGGNDDEDTLIYVPETGRIAYTIGGSVGAREQVKFSDQPKFPEGTQPLYSDNGELEGYRIKKGVLGIEEDIDVKLGADPKVEEVFQARHTAGPYEGRVENTYDRYVQLFHEEASYCKRVDHVVKFDEQPWELTRQGHLKWVVHPRTEVAAKDKWIYFQEIPPGSSSGKHRHAYEELIFVLDGKGHDVHDGERWEWKSGELIVIPAMTEHQHFASEDGRTLTLHAMPRMYEGLGLGGIEQIEDCPEWESEVAAHG